MRGYVVYSIYRQRRLIALCAALPGLAGLMFFSPAVGICLAVAMGIAAAVILGLWPVSHIDTIGLSLATALVVPVAAYIGHLASFAVGNNADLATLWLTLLLAVSWFFLWLGVSRALCLLDNVHAGQIDRHDQAYVDLPPEEAVKALSISPNSQTAIRETGPANEDGYFEVSFEVDGVDLADFTETRVRHTYLARIIEESREDGVIRKVQQTVLPDLTPVRSSVIEQEFIPQGEGTLYRFREVHDLFSVLSWALFWLQDAGPDQVQAELDAYAGRPVQSCTYGPQTTLLTVIARWFVENGYAPRNDPDA